MRSRLVYDAVVAICENLQISRRDVSEIVGMSYPPFTDVHSKNRFTTEEIGLIVPFLAMYNTLSVRILYAKNQQEWFHTVNKKINNLSPLSFLKISQNNIQKLDSILEDIEHEI